MSLGHAAIFAGRLHSRGGFHRLAEGLNGNARRRRDVFITSRRVDGGADSVLLSEERLSSVADAANVVLVLIWIGCLGTLTALYFSSTIVRRDVHAGVSPRGWTRSAGLSTIAARLR